MTSLDLQFVIGSTYPLFLAVPICLEEVTAHLSISAIPVQTSDAFVRRFLARVEVLAVRLSVPSSANIHRSQVLYFSSIIAVCMK